ncbi:MAG: 3-deoxy-D-manno-octulosonic acid transferase, partial [Kaistella sp.]
MFFLYNVLMAVAGFCLKAIALFSPKIRLFVDGRKDVFQILRSKITTGDKIIWFHAASLGEYEQGIPVMEKVKILYPDHKLLLTFFSPSGFEVRKNNTIADITVYLPWDTISNVRKFLNIARPKLVFFVKYEYWPNYLKELRKRKIDTYLISGIFRENQVFFKWYGGFYRKALDTFNHFFVQNALSKELLLKLGKSNVTVSGDTRFDRVAAILEKDNSLDFISEFKDDKLLVVIGSSWPKDEKLLIEYINAAEADVKFIFAPHNIKEDQIKELASGLQKKPILFSEKD